MGKSSKSGKRKSSSRKRVHKKSNYIEIDKYDLYMKAVQSPDADAEFLNPRIPRRNPMFRILLALLLLMKAYA